MKKKSYLCAACPCLFSNEWAQCCPLWLLRKVPPTVAAVLTTCRLKAKLRFRLTWGWQRSIGTAAAALLLTGISFSTVSSGCYSGSRQ